MSILKLSNKLDLIGSNYFMLRRPSADLKQPIEFICLVCSQQFNTSDRVPLIICPRIHSCCLHCFETRLFNQAEKDAQVFCFHCHLPIKKSEAKRFDLFEQVLKSAVSLKAKDGSLKQHPSEVQEDTQKIGADLAQQKIKNEWLIQQYITLERSYKNLIHKHAEAEAQHQRRTKRHQRNIERVCRLTWEARGAQLLNEGKFKEVIELSQEIIKAAPGIDFEIDGFGSVQDRAGAGELDVIAWYNQTAKKPSNPYDILCLSFTQLENYQEAQSWYSHRLGKDKDNYRMILGLANILYNSGKYAQAEKLYFRTIQLKPDLEKSYTQLAFIKTVKENKKQEGRKWAAIAKQKNEYSLYADYLLAISQDSTEAQIQKLTLLSETLPKSYPRIYNALGFAFKQKKEQDEAISYFKKCIELNPSYEVPYFNLGLIHQQRGQIEEAACYYQQSIQKNSKYVNAYLGLGNLYAKKKGEEQKAIKWYLKCLEVNPLSVSAHNGLGRAYAITQNYTEAIKSFKKCIQFNQKHEFSYNSLGNVYFYKGEFEEAIKWYEKCIEINPKYLGPYNGLCNVYGKKGEQEQAKKWCERRDAISSPSS